MAVARRYDFQDRPTLQATSAACSIRNSPLLETKLAIQLFANQQESLAKANPELLVAWHCLTTTGDGAGFDLFFRHLRNSRKPTLSEAQDAIRSFLQGKARETSVNTILEQLDHHDWALAYALAWLSVAIPACRPDNLAQHRRRGPSTSPLRGYRTLHTAKSIWDQSPHRLSPLPCIPCLTDIATPLR